MYPGWFSYGGTEIANSARTVAYADHAGLEGVSIFDCNGCDNFNEVVGDDPYSSPIVDNAPWVDANNSDTWDFYGFLPLSAEGVEDSTLTASVTELATDGGYVSGVRQAGREMRFTGLLVGQHPAAVQAGMTWLKHALEGQVCREGPNCTGDHFCYLAACPEVCDDSPDRPQGPVPVVEAPLHPVDPADGGLLVMEEKVGDPLPYPLMCPYGTIGPWPEACVRPLERHMLRVTCIDGPKLIAIHQSGCSTQLWEVEFTLYAGVSGPYGTPNWVGCITDDDQLPSREIVDRVICDPDTGLRPIQDPNCIIPAPPRPPLVLDECVDSPVNWRRYEFRLDGEFIPGWSEAVPIIRINTKYSDVRQVRIRFWANPFGIIRPDVLDESCDYCGEFIISYIPKNSLMILDGMEQTATIETYDGDTAVEFQGTRWSATHLLYGTGGTPMSWPLLTCGIQYSMTLDVSPDTINQLEICLCMAVRE